MDETGTSLAPGIRSPDRSSACWRFPRPDALRLKPDDLIRLSPCSWHTRPL